MTDNQNDMLKEETDSSKGVTIKLGELLKQAREKKGLSVAQIADQLHLRVAIVKDIEADNFENIASITYTKGYIKNYARIVDIEQAEIEYYIDQYFPHAEPPTMQSFSSKADHQTKDNRLMIVTYVIVAILVVLLIWWWVQKSSTVSNVSFSKPSVEELADAKLDKQIFDKQITMNVDGYSILSKADAAPIPKNSRNATAVSLIGG